MSDLILHIATRAQVARYSAVQAISATAGRAYQRFTREQSGQDMVEYAGVLLIVALIIAAVAASPLGDTIKNGISGLVNDVLHGTNPQSGGTASTPGG
jgi:Flp pilus assembly pilin Flp